MCLCVLCPIVFQRKEWRKWSAKRKAKRKARKMKKTMKLKRQTDRNFCVFHISKKKPRKYAFSCLLFFDALAATVAADDDDDGCCCCRCRRHRWLASMEMCVRRRNATPKPIGSMFFCLSSSSFLHFVRLFAVVFLAYCYCSQWQWYCVNVSVPATISRGSFIFLRSTQSVGGCNVAFSASLFIRDLLKYITVNL